MRGCKAVQFHLTGRYLQGDKVKGKGRGFDPNLRFINLNQSKIDALCKYMADNKKSRGTILGIVKHVRQLAKLAQDEGIKVGSLNFKPPKNYGGSKRVTTQVRLTFAEIRKIAELNVPDDLRKLARDQFLLQCFTGLRLSNSSRLTSGDIYEDYIDIKQKKTGQIGIPTIGMHVKPIIDAYKAKADSQTVTLFPKLTPEYFRRAIKKICEEAGLTDEVNVTKYYGPQVETNKVRKCDRIATHTGRRSFSRMLSSLGVSEAMIDLELGHETGSLARHYIGSPEHSERIRIVQEASRKAEEILLPPLQVQRTIGVNAA